MRYSVLLYITVCFRSFCVDL